MRKVRRPAVAGMFYPSDKNELERMLEKLMNDAEQSEKINAPVLGIVAPHAGYIYSGETAARAYNQIKNKNYERVVVISPSHREYFKGISIFEGESYLTPLGEVEIDTEARDEMISNSEYIFAGLEGHGEEHALEVQLPFLQKSLGNFKLLPIVLGDQSKIFIDELAGALAEIADDKTLIVASSDLSHFYNVEKANAMDSIVDEKITAFDPEGLQLALENGQCEACGGGAIVALLKAGELLKKNKSKVLHRSDSGDVSGDKSEVVGYLSAAIFGE